MQHNEVRMVDDKQWGLGATSLSLASLMIVYGVMICWLLGLVMLGSARPKTVKTG